jgi:putative spermidine/putrescine transport system permease protein
VQYVNRAFWSTRRAAPVSGVWQRPAWLRRPLQSDRVRLILSVGPIAILFAIVYIGSLVRMVLLSFEAPDWTVHQYVALARDTNLLNVLWYTFLLAASIALICLALAYPVALVMLHASPAMRRLLTVVVIIPMWVSTLVRSYAWIVLLGRRGVVNNALVATGLTTEPLSLLYNRFAVYVGLVYVLLPFMVFPIYGAMRQIDLRLIDAARSLGANRFTAVLCVFVPLTVPGVAVGTILVFVMGMAYWVTPTLLGGIADTTFVMLIEQQINSLGNWSFGAAMSVVLLIITLVILFLFQKGLGFGIVGRSGDLNQRNLKFLNLLGRLAGAFLAVSRKLRVRSAPRPMRRGATLEVRQRTPVAWAITIAVVIYLLGPILILFPLAFTDSQYLRFPPTGFSLQWFARYFSDRTWTEPTLVSLRVGIVTAVVATVIGTMAAISLAKARFRFRNALIAVILSPLVVPAIVIAVALYFQFAPLGLVGTQTGLVLAHLIFSTPFVVIVVLGALQNFDYSLERAARSLGAGPFVTFRRITFPLISPAMIAAMFFAFIISFDEVIVAVFLSGTSAPTLPKQLLNATRFEFRPTIAAVSVLLVLGTVVIMICVGLMQRLLSRSRPATGSTG